jgi:hypothetical protein
MTEKIIHWVDGIDMHDRRDKQGNVKNTIRDKKDIRGNWWSEAFPLLRARALFLSQCTKAAGA